MTLPPGPTPLQQLQNIEQEARTAGWVAAANLRLAVKIARETRSAQEIANELGISRQRVWQLLNGK